MDGRTDGQRQNNIPPPSAGDNKSVLINKVMVWQFIHVSKLCRIVTTVSGTFASGTFVVEGCTVA